ncbi:MAG: Hsp70 family protein [Mogibacterium sp.]|nr:Hsp70 family protein [Mogibacterium sp.]
MAYYIGIDLGTTNSAICSYDGMTTRIWKSPEQTDVTPSAIYIDKRGNRYYGQKACSQATYNPGNSATLFKRFLGTDKKIHFEDADITMSPEECSAEILRVLYGYLPDEIRSDPETATVITVPAAFGVMKKDATMEAARKAGIGRVALMQEPVAAVMSILKESPEDGLFLVYDLGGGTFDVSIAENIAGKVSLLANGGIEICGGRDIDRKMFDTIVMPWLRENFVLPEDLSEEKKYRKLVRIAQWACERAKIELSYSGTGTIAMTEDEVRCDDEEGNEIYFDIVVTTDQMNELMEGIISDTVSASRETIAKTGLRTEDIAKIVFIGGPTNYSPLREKVAEMLGIPANTGVNPMTAVAEGASVFAESIDWSGVSHNRKKMNDSREIAADLTLKYITRTPSDKAKVMLAADSGHEDLFIQFESTDTGWVSGKMPVRDKLISELPLTQMGDNHFIAVITDGNGDNAGREPENIVITRTLATVSAIPASHSIGIEVQSRLGGESELVFLVREGDRLPHKGVIRVKAGRTVKAGSAESLNIKLWEGDIQSRIEDNRFIGMLKIRGVDIEAGVIPVGADIDCEYEVSDSGHITLEASVPYIAATFKGHNLYSRQEGVDSIDKNMIANAGTALLIEIESMLTRIPDPRLYDAKVKAMSASCAALLKDDDTEQIQKADSDLQEARKIAGRFRKENQRLVKEVKLSERKSYYERNVREYADAAEQKEIENYFTLAELSMAGTGEYFEDIISDLSGKFASVLWKQDWYILLIYEDYTADPSEYTNEKEFARLKKSGDAAREDADFAALRRIVIRLSNIRIRRNIAENGSAAIFDPANIIKG